MDSCLIGLGQILVEGGAVERNLDRACRMIESAASEGCRVLVLPECLDAGWTHPDARRLALPIPGPASDRLAEAARRSGLLVAAGLTEWDRGRIYNAAVLLSPSGEILLKHRKINELPDAGGLYATGDRLAVVDTPLGLASILICADNFPETLFLGRSLGRMGCRLLLSPSAWAMEASHDNERDPYGSLWLGSYTTLTTEYPMTIAAASNVGPIDAGPWKGRRCIGCSLAVGPGAQVLARGPYGPAAEALVKFQASLDPAWRAASSE